MAVTTTQIEQVYKLIVSAEGLKRELRHSWLSDGRQESVADHCWQLCLMALLLMPLTDKPLDQGKVLKLLIIHDLPEAVVGDVPVFDCVSISDKALKFRAEHDGLKGMIDGLGAKQAENIEQLWLEFEAKTTIEARFAHALDKLEAQVQHNQADISTWTEWELKRAFGDLDQYCVDFPVLVELNTILKKEAAQKLYAAGIELTTYGADAFLT
jgi:putative hydrolases of HD superfamily